MQPSITSVSSSSGSAQHARDGGGDQGAEQWAEGENLVGLLEVVAGAEQLDVLGGDAGTALAERHIVVEVQVVGRAALDAAAIITLPDRDLHGRGYLPRNR